MNKFMFEARDDFYATLIEQEIRMFHSIGYVTWKDLKDIVERRGFNEEEIKSLMKGINSMEILSSKPLIQYLETRKEAQELGKRLRAVLEQKELLMHSLATDDLKRLLRDCKKPYEVFKMDDERTGQ